MTSELEIAVQNKAASIDHVNKVVTSLVLRGDISALNAEEKTAYYIRTCESLGLNPSSSPLAFLKLNGKEVLYPQRGATDQLAAIHKITREIIDGPKVVDLGGTKLVFAVCRATHPNGRTETSVATLPLADPVNVFMKCETKAKRRATLSILGLGMLDETEVDSIPVTARGSAQQAEVAPTPAPTAAPTPVPSTGGFAARFSAARGMSEVLAICTEIGGLHEPQRSEALAAYASLWEGKIRAATDLGALDTIRARWGRVDPGVRGALADRIDATFAHQAEALAPQDEPGERG